MGWASNLYKHLDRRTKEPAPTVIGVASVPFKVKSPATPESQETLVVDTTETSETADALNTARITDAVVVTRQRKLTPLALGLLLLALMCAVAGTTYLLSYPDEPSLTNPPASTGSPADDESASTSPSPSPSPSASESAAATAQASQSTTRVSTTTASTKAPTTAAPTGDVSTATVGDCFVDNGSSDNPDLRKVTCASGTLQVLSRLNGTTDMSKCQSVAGTTNMYFFEFTSSNTGTTRFVLCMKAR